MHRTVVLADLYGIPGKTSRRKKLACYLLEIKGEAMCTGLQSQHRPHALWKTADTKYWLAGKWYAGALRAQ